ncbi:hypothetical protein SO694_00005147 [Aureococcus anophagefferens]|uniref:Uncharacterized protein n=1 Tax=Aureococcus anophagefferens TaxID=44056 RepID=A0ABR1G913_AURAN
MEINRLVLPQRDGLGDTSETTAAKGRARFRYLEETSSVRDPREAGMERYASGLGRDTLSLVRSCEVGYETTDPSALSKGDASDDEDDNDSADSDDEKPPPPAAPVSSRRRRGPRRAPEDLTAEEKQTNLMMDMDWDTTQWSLREIEAALPDDAPEAEVLLHEKENRERCRRKYFAKCMEHEALVNKWKRAKAERLADLGRLAPKASIARMDKEPGGLKRKKKSALKGGMDYHHVTKTALVDRAVRSYLQLLDAMASSKPGQEKGDSTSLQRRSSPASGADAPRVCGKKGEGITGLVCIARLHGDDEKRCKALRILLLVASVPLLARACSTATRRACRVSLLNVREPLKVRRLALDVLQAASLSVLTCCRQPATARVAGFGEGGARRRGSGTPPRPGTGASGASDRAPSTPGGSEVDRPPSTAGSGGRRKARGDRGDEAFHEPCGEVDAVRELARPGWLAVVLELLNGRDEALFLGAVRFCQRCAASCEGAMRHVLKEVLAFGGRPLERAIVGGLASGPNRGGRARARGLRAQLTTFPPGRMGLVAARVEDMLAPLLASGDPTQPAFLRSLIVLLYASRVGRSPVVLPGALGDECVADQDSRSYRRLQKGRRRDKPSTPADAHKRDAATLTDHCRGAFEALCGASDDDVAASGLVLAKLKAAMPIFQFLCQPKKQSFLYELERRARYAHCVVLRRLFGAAPPLPRMLFDCGADALLRFCSFAVQAGFNEIEDGDVKHLSASDRRLHYFAVESMLLTLSCAANVKDEGFVDCGLDADRAEKRRLNALRDDRAGRGLRRRGGISSALTGSDARELRDDARDDDDERDDGAQLISVASTTSQTTSASLLEAPVAPRNLVAQMLLSTSTLGDVLGLARRVPTSEIVAIDALAAAEAKVVSAAAAFVAAAAPVPFPDKLHDLKYEPAVGEDAGYAAAEVTLRPLRAQAVDPLRASLSVDAPLECRAAACGALAKLGATPAGADELHARGVIRGVIRALSRLAPRRPVTQAAVDKVIRSVPRSAIIDGDHSATLHLDLETCRLVRLPVAWYEFAASAALSPGACHAMLEARVVLRCVERFSFDTDKPPLDWAIRSTVALLIARMTTTASTTAKLKAFGGKIHELVLNKKYKLAPYLIQMLSAESTSGATKYNAAFAVAALCSANVAAAAPCLVEQGILPALVGLLLEPKTKHPLLRHVLVALRAILRFPGGDYGWLLAKSEARNRSGKTVLDRLRQIAIDLRLLNHQRLVRGRPALNDLARDLLSAMHGDLEKTSKSDRARERRGALGGHEVAHEIVAGKASDVEKQEMADLYAMAERAADDFYDDQLESEAASGADLESYDATADEPPNTRDGLRTADFPDALGGDLADDDAPAPAPAEPPRRVSMAAYHQAEVDAWQARRAAPVEAPPWEAARGDDDGDDDDEALASDDSRYSSEDELEAQRASRDKAVQDAIASKRELRAASDAANAEVNRTGSMFLSAEELVRQETDAENKEREEAALLAMHRASLPAAPPEPAPLLERSSVLAAPSTDALHAEPSGFSQTTASEDDAPFAATMTAAEVAEAATIADAAADVQGELDATRGRRRAEAARERLHVRKLGDAPDAPKRPIPRYETMTLDARPDLALTRRRRAPRRDATPAPASPPPPSLPARPRGHARELSDPVFSGPSSSAGRLERFDDLELPRIDPSICAVTFDNIHEITTRRRAIGMRRKRAQKARTAFHHEPKAPPQSKLAKQLAEARAGDPATARELARLSKSASAANGLTPL